MLILVGRHASGGSGSQESRLRDGIGCRCQRDSGLDKLGVDSLTALELRDSLQTDLQLQLPSSLVFDYPTVGALSAYLLANVADNLAVREQENDSGFDESSSDADTLPAEPPTHPEPNPVEQPPRMPVVAVPVDVAVQKSLAVLQTELAMWER